MKSKLIGFLKAKYKDNKDIRFLDGKGWNADLYNRKTRIHIKITSQNDGDMEDDRQTQDFYELYIYKGFSNDIRNNRFIGREYSDKTEDYNSAIEIIDSILLKYTFKRESGIWMTWL